MNTNDFLGKIYNKDENYIEPCSEFECLCSECKDMRNMAVSMWNYSKPHKNICDIIPINNNSYNIDKNSVTKDIVIDSVFPSLWIAKCKQCKKDHIIVLYKIDNNKHMLILSESLDGIATENTPKAVKYYLDQAYKSKMIGANSACVAMYRAALEQALFEQGYTGGMLNAKIKALEKDKDEGKGKEWVKNIDEELFIYIKELGNGSMHPNDGDISKQSVFDNNLMSSIDIVFKEFLDKIYEKPVREAKLKDILGKAARKFDR